MFKTTEIQNTNNDSDDALRQAIYNNYTVNEDTYLEQMLSLATPTPEMLARITTHATDLVKKIRASPLAKEGVEAFLQQYRLDTPEGMILMCLAEALLRIPDAEVANKLIKDNFSVAHWEKYLGQSPSWFSPLIESPILANR
jgi:RHH-type proline utilization regulon transcriptional repressor/proline dehydrogenase/delta 1-pyrroline-5-carboxylate dehydrogenase